MSLAKVDSVSGSEAGGTTADGSWVEVGAEGASGEVRGPGVSGVEAVGLADNMGLKAIGSVLAEPVDAGRDGGVEAEGKDSTGADATTPRDFSPDSTVPISEWSRASELSLIP